MQSQSYYPPGVTGTEPQIVGSPDADENEAVELLKELVYCVVQSVHSNNSTRGSKTARDREQRALSNVFVFMTGRKPTPSELDRIG